MNEKITKAVRVWLMIGVVLIFVQVIIGGVTRLTDSGLSITEWEIVKGTLPPFGDVAWQEAFDKYKSAAKKQHEALHADMSLSEFKVIYFWEWFHRLWARSMGFIFLFPFLFFVYKKQMPWWLIKRLGIVIFLAALVATFGWIMVASGLNDDNRTWVSAYKLLIHLLLASVLFGYLFWTWLLAKFPDSKIYNLPKLKKASQIITGFVLLQIAFGALMAGMRAGLIHPYFPMFIKFKALLSTFKIIPGGIMESVVNYESGVFMKGVVQILHRSTAYILSVLILVFFIKARKQNIPALNLANNMLISMLVLQFILGILTIINCFGKVPLVYGVLHQAGALILFAVCLFSTFLLRKETLQS